MNMDLLLVFHDICLLRTRQSRFQMSIFTHLKADISLRGTNEPPPNLVGKRIARIGFGVYGTKELLKQVIDDPDADNIPCVTWVGDGHTRPVFSGFKSFSVLLQTLTT